MSYVAGMLLLHCGPPDACFKVFCNILNMELVNSFYSFDMEEINRIYKVFWKLLRQQMPVFYTALRTDQVSCHAFLFEWIATLFTCTLELEACAYLWDQVFYSGELFLLKGALAICSVLQELHFAELQAGADPLKIIKEARKHVTKDKLEAVLTSKRASAAQCGLKGLKLDQV